MKVIIYTKDGNNYLGEHTLQKLSYWKWYGQQKNQIYLYKGYRYFDNTKSQVIVYSNNLWNKNEIQRRKNNGFLGIKRYTCKNY